MNPLRDSFTPIIHPAYTVHPARYAKGKLAVRCLDGVAGMKGRAARLLDAVAPSAGYSNREHAMICSPGQVAKFIAAFARNADGHLGERNGRLEFVLAEEETVP